MIRLGVLFLVTVLFVGCSTSHKVVVQDGYRGLTQAPSTFEPQRPAALIMNPEPEPPRGTTTSAAKAPEMK